MGNVGRAAVASQPGDFSAKIHRLHGALDSTFPSRYIREATIIPTGGHVLPLTHPDAVASFLIQGMQYDLPGSCP